MRHLLAHDPVGRLAAATEDLAELTRALTRAADLTTGVEGAYTQASGDLEAAWLAIAARARHRGTSSADDS